VPRLWAARRGAEGACRLCGAAEKISRRRASRKYNRKWKAAKFDGKHEEKHREGRSCLLLSNIRAQTTGDAR
jgi:hypothetical protein